MNTFKKIAAAVTFTMSLSLSFAAHAAPDKLQLPVKEVSVAARTSYQRDTMQLGERKLTAEASRKMRATVVESVKGIDLSAPDLSAPAVELKHEP